MRALALDFDGVISDSAAEAFAVALVTYTELRPSAAWRELAARVQGLRRSELLAEPLCRAFVEAMPLGNRAEDFGVVLAALDAGDDLVDQAAYDRVYGRIGAAFRGEFHARFYAERRAFRERAPEDWLALMGPYDAFVDALRAHAGSVTLAIATAKDRPSVELLLAEYGIRDLFPPERVLDKQTGSDKRAHIGVLAERLGLDFGEITFVDDKVNHLESVSRLGVRCALAGWGYNAEREWRLAERLGFRVLELDRVTDDLFGASA